MKKFFAIILVLSFSKSVISQEISQTLNADEVLQLVRTFHPIVRQSNIAIEKSKADILNARGNFDPILNGYSGQKTLDGINYYKEVSSELKIPAWYGVDFFAGVDQLSGERLNPSESKGTTGTLGINIPLVKNLLLDKRRASLQQAKLYNSMAAIDQQIMINDICLEAMTAYWKWVKSYENYKLIEANFLNNEKRLDLIKKSVENGELPKIDIVEATTQLRSFEILKNERFAEFQNAGLELSAYFWTINTKPYELPETIIPQNNWDDESSIEAENLNLNELLSQAFENHPNLKIYPYKIDILEIEKKLKFQELLPKIDFRYNFLAKEFNYTKSISDSSPFQNNYQFGFKMEIPLFFSQGRANYKIAKLKIEDAKLDQIQKERNIEVKIKYYFNQFTALKTQIALQVQNSQDYKTLVKAEESKFSNGESSLFLINSRESKSIAAEEKLIEIKTKFFNSIYLLKWSAGLLR